MQNIAFPLSPLYSLSLSATQVTQANVFLSLSLPSNPISCLCKISEFQSRRNNKMLFSSSLSICRHVYEKKTFVDHKKWSAASLLKEREKKNDCSRLWIKAPCHYTIAKYCERRSNQVTSPLLASVIFADTIWYQFSPPSSFLNQGVNNNAHYLHNVLTWLEHNNPPSPFMRK